VLTVQGTAGNDQIEVASNDDFADHIFGIVVHVNGKTASFAELAVRAIRIEAGAGNDSISSFNCDLDATLVGGNGNDTLTPGAAGEVLIGGSGNDTADFSSAENNLRITLDNKPNDHPPGALPMNVESDIENVIGGSGNDLIVGNPSFNHFIGGPGNDTLYGGDGNDTLEGGPGHDHLFGQAGNDLLLTRDQTHDTLDGGHGFDSAMIDDTAFVKDKATSIEAFL
jgi:Ca2+-binding RTX toxin-like protein